VFRAAPNYWKYLLVVWGFRQMLAAIALAVAFTFSWAGIEAVGHAGDVTVVSREGKVRGKIGSATMRRVADWIHVAEFAGLGFFFLQAPFSFAAARLGYEMRWYMVTDRSLRLREGIFGVREMTLTFANVQNITIRQGPLQRLLGISDVVVQTAGGGGSSEAQGHPGHGDGGSMHTGVLRAVDNAESVRDLILERLRRLRDAGLGDPDDRHRAVPPPSDATDALRIAARELLDEARALRSSLG
jgi:uncharacterized membrane protein YdbT with pleckstrin-like domain